MNPYRDNPLGSVKVASPCKADWNSMFGGERVRFCSDCKMNVYNLTAMRRIDAERLIANTEGRLCVRFYRRKDGTILTKDCPVGLAAVRARMKRIASAAAGVVIGFFGGVSVVPPAQTNTVMGTLRVKPPVEQRYTPEMGAVAVQGDIGPERPRPTRTR